MRFTYATQVVEADPSLRRAHAVRADVLLKEGLTGDAIKEADYPLELGHAQATAVHRINKLHASMVAESATARNAHQPDKPRLSVLTGTGNGLDSYK